MPHDKNARDCDRSELGLTDVSQEMLAGNSGATRPRVSYFMNKFRRLGFVAYGKDIEVRHGLVSVMSPDWLGDLGGWPLWTRRSRYSLVGTLVLVKRDLCVPFPRA